MSEAPVLQKQDFVFIKSEYKIVKIKFDDILFCKGMKDYIINRTKEIRQLK